MHGLAASIMRLAKHFDVSMQPGSRSHSGKLIAIRFANSGDEEILAKVDKRISDNKIP